MYFAKTLLNGDIVFLCFKNLGTVTFKEHFQGAASLDSATTLNQ